MQGFDCLPRVATRGQARRSESRSIRAPMQMGQREAAGQTKHGRNNEMKTTKRKANSSYQSAPNIHTPKLPPTSEQIRQLAYEIQYAGGGHCHPLISWLQTEHELNTGLSWFVEDHPAVQDQSSPPKCMYGGMVFGTAPCEQPMHENVNHGICPNCAICGAFAPLMPVVENCA